MISSFVFACYRCLCRGPSSYLSIPVCLWLVLVTGLWLKVTACLSVIPVHWLASSPLLKFTTCLSEARVYHRFVVTFSVCSSVCHLFVVMVAACLSVAQVCHLFVVSVTTCLSVARFCHLFVVTVTTCL